LATFAVNLFSIRRTKPDGKTIDLTYNPDGRRLSKFITHNSLTQRQVHYLTYAKKPPTHFFS
jgi:YD repeat-containing protein